jgi:uncharacterized protein (TIGR03032 family)
MDDDASAKVPGDTPLDVPSDVPMSGIHTASFAQILDKLGFSLAVTTYQAGKLVILRPDRRSGVAVVNTHFRQFARPMGFAWEPDRFALGTRCEISEFHNLPLNTPEPDGSPTPDAEFLPRLCHTTGDVAVHEMVWVPDQLPIAGDPNRKLSELWFVNTRFSCLATRNDQFSFEPRWRPPFISRLAAEDRCHLNGMCLRDGQVGYVTALGHTDEPAGWRTNKATGGIVMDVQSNEIITRGLSMPHSPRWRDGKLWVLESGNGGIGVIDFATGKYREVARLPGFTRGLDFAGVYAFVGLSQVRETATFGGIAVTEIPESDRCCGVWVIDTRSGKIVGYVKFTGDVREIFAVTVLAGLRWPDVFNDDTQRIGSTFKLPPGSLQG